MPGRSDLMVFSTQILDLLVFTVLTFGKNILMA